MDRCSWTRQRAGRWTYGPPRLHPAAGLLDGSLFGKLAASGWLLRYLDPKTSTTKLILLEHMMHSVPIYLG